MIPLTARRLAFVAALLASTAATAWGAPRRAPTAPKTDVCGELAANTTWDTSGSPYRVTCNVIVPTGITLAVSSGVEVQFDEAVGLRVNGALNVGGSSKSDVLFTTSQSPAAPGAWTGIQLTSGSTASLAGFTLEYAGSHNDGALRIETEGVSVSNASVSDNGGPAIEYTKVGGTVTNTEVKNNDGHGIVATASTATGTRLELTNDVFQDNDNAVNIDVRVDTVMSGNVARGNKENGVVIQATTLDAPVTLHGGDMPYILPRTVSVRATMTIQPNTYIKAASGSISVQPDGTLLAQGTADQPVVLTSLYDDVCADTGGKVDCDSEGDGGAKEPGPGDWGNISVRGPNSSFSYVELGYGKDNVLTLSAEGISVSHVTLAHSSGDAVAVDGVSSTITDSTFDSNAGDAVQVTATGSISVTVQNCTFEHNKAVVSAPADVVLTTGGNKVPGFTNAINGYAVSGNMETQREWAAGDLPFVINGVLTLNRPAAELLMGPGLTVKIAEGGALRVTRGLLRVGTEGGAKVLITSLHDDACSATEDSGCDTNGDGSATRPSPGSWRDLVIDSEGRGGFIASAIIRYGGVNTPMVVLTHPQGSLKDVEIAHSGDVGLSVQDVNNTTIEGVTLRGNKGHGLEVQSATGGSTITLRDDTFVDNKSDDPVHPAAAVAIDANVQLLFDSSNTASGNELNGIAIVNGDVTTSRSWAPSALPYLVLDDLIVKDGATFTITPGTIIKFNKSQGLRADRSGRLSVTGTADNPVILTSLNDDSAGGDSNPDVAAAPNAGDWDGVTFLGTSRGGGIEGADIRYAGGSSDPSVTFSVPGVFLKDSSVRNGAGDGVLFDDVPGGAGETVAVTGNTVQDMEGDGIVMTAGNGPTQPEVQDNEIHNTRYALSLEANVAPSLGGNVATGNLVNGLVVKGTLSVRRTWEASELPWVLDGSLHMSAGSWLEIEAGTVIKARPGADLQVDGGRLVVPKADTGDMPVTFTSINDDTACAGQAGQQSCDATSDDAPPRRGDWDGINVKREADPATLKNMVIAYAGGTDQALRIDAPRSELSDSMIVQSGGDGLRLYDATQVVVANNLFQRNNGNAIYLSRNASGSFTGNILTQNLRSVYHDSKGVVVTSDNVAVGNDNDAMLYCADVTADTTWRNDLAREVRTNCVVDISAGTLVLEPGTLVQFASGGQIRVSGRLEAEGAVFTPSEADAPGGSWKGLSFQPSGKGIARSNLILGAGSSTVGGIDIHSSDVTALFNTMLRMDRTGLSVSNRANPEIRGNLIREIDGSESTAIRIADEGTNPNLTDNLLGGAVYGVYTIQGKPVLRHNNISGLTGMGVSNRSKTCVDAKENWWGAATGPNDAKDSGDNCGPGLNNGAGVPVSEGVDYSGWLSTSPPMAPMVDLPMCGVTNQAEQTVSGRSTAGATLKIYDGDRVAGQTTVESDGRFETTVQLGSGPHKLSFEAASGTPEVNSPRTGFRVVTVDTSPAVDPAGIRFEYGPSRTLRKQPLHDATGCATKCGSRSSGRVELPPGEEVVVSAPVSGSPSSVAFVQEGAQPQPMTSRGNGIYATAAFQPIQGSFTIEVNGAAPVVCYGYIYPGGGGFVFADTGAEGDPLMSEDFEGATAPPVGWRTEPPWAVTDEKGYQSAHSLSSSPGEKYGPNVDASVYMPGPIDLTDTPSPELHWTQDHHFAPSDYGYVEIAVGSTASWKRLARFEGATAGWSAASVNLEDYATDTKVFIRFRFTSNKDDKVDDGWYIDNVTIAPGGRFNGRYDPGEPLMSGEEVLLEQRNVATGLWEEWDPTPTGQSNPQTTDDAGRYGFYNLPAGEYRIRVGGAARSPVLAVATGSLNYEMPIAGGQSVFLPIVANKARVDH